MYLLDYNQRLTTASVRQLFGSVARVVVLYRGSTCSILSYGEGNISAMLLTFCGFHVLRLMMEEHLPKGSSTDGLDKLKVINSGHLKEKARVCPFKSFQ